MAKFSITTLGCKVNRHESDLISTALENHYYKEIADNAQPDFCIINTCCVTQKAAMQSRQAVRRAIRANPKALIIVTGCYAQIESKLLSQIKGVTSLVGQADKYQIPGMISAYLDHGLPLEQKICSDIRKQKKFSYASELRPKNRTRPFLKIQDGCDAFCTYCIIPYTRGPSRSMEPDLVIDNLKYLAQAGYQEVVLTGIHLGRFGLDLEPRLTLFDLLKSIYRKKIIRRIRLSSIEPCELTDEIIDLVASSAGVKNSICPHFHIPLQSGDDAILKKMGRPYTSDKFITLVKKIKQVIPQAAIGVDLLTGFPGETKKAFENTYALIEKLPVSYLHIFPFSPRKGTPAFGYSNKIALDIIKARCKKMRELGLQKKDSFFKNFIGQSTEILVESTRDKVSGRLLKGFTPNYIPVLLEGPDLLKNSIIKVKIQNVDSDLRVFAEPAG